MNFTTNGSQGLFTTVDLKLYGHVQDLWSVRLGYPFDSQVTRCCWFFRVRGPRPRAFVSSLSEVTTYTYYPFQSRVTRLRRTNPKARKAKKILRARKVGDGRGDELSNCDQNHARRRDPFPSFSCTCSSRSLSPFFFFKKVSFACLFLLLLLPLVVVSFV
jgi:hypothetical protein